MFDKNNKNYKFYLAGIISESQYYDLCEGYPMSIDNPGKVAGDPKHPKMAARQAITDIGMKITHADKMGDKEAAENFKKDLRKKLEVLKYNWQVDPYALTFLDEASNDGNRMLMNNLKDIKEYADLILSMLEDHDQLDEWMENKISVCRAYMSDVGHAFKNDKDEDEEEGGCGGIPVASMGAKSMDLTPITSLYQAMR